MVSPGLITAGMIAAALLLLSSKPATALAYFNKGTLPSTFTVGMSYPNLPETSVCRRLQTYISRDSDRFRAEMVTNSDPTINFANSDARIMSSRMQSQLGLLKHMFTGSFTVLKGWADFPDPDLSNDTGSLHYDGRSIRVNVTDWRRISEFLRIAVQVRFDWVQYTSRQFVRLTVVPTGCLRNSDIVFILDASGSIGATNFIKVIKFLLDATTYFSIAPNATRVGLVEFSTVSTKVFSLNTYTTVQSLQAAIKRITYTQGWTGTGLGLLDGLDLLNASKPYGARPLSQGLPRTAVLITDGYSNRGPSVASVAPMLRNAGISVYAVGVGNNIRESELVLIANSPAAQYVYGINSYDDADGFVNLLSYTTCDTPACVNPADDISGAVAGDDITYYCSMCRAFSRKVIVHVKDIEGKSHLYGSGRDLSPGPLTNSSSLRRNESLDMDSRSLMVDVDNTTKVVYVGVKGYKTRSRFSMFISDTLFGSMVYSISINDSFTLSTAVFNASANLVTQARSNTLRYSILSGNDYRDFSIDSLTGVVRVNGTLNAIARPSHVLVIVTQNFTMDCHRARLELVITVRRSTLYGTTATARVPENAPPGTPVALVSVLGGNVNIQFAFDGVNIPPFAINSSGWILVNGQLNYEAQQNYSLTVRFTSSITRATATAVQLVLVTDVNEAPFFILCGATNSCVGQVYENRPSGSSANVTVTAADPDFSYLANGMFSYALQPLYPFAVSSAGGVITTSLSLDREKVASYTFTVTVTDRGTPPLSAATSVRVIVLDVNDNPPVISGPVYLEAREDASVGTALANYTATDADVGINAVIQFVLVAGGATLPFAIDMNSGALTLRSTLSFQTRPSYNFRVVARNPDGLNDTSSSANVTLRVIAVNSHAPVFVGAPYLTSVVENSAIGTVVVSINATDADSGANGVVRYAIVQGNTFNSFSLNATSGQLRVSANIDREVIDRFFLVVRAYDLGFPSLSATATVNVTVIDVNDNSPVFNPSSYMVTVRESIAVGSVLVTVSATDKDQPGNPNSQFDYSIANPTFSISPNGSIRLAAPLNFSLASSYQLAVVATDHGTPPLNGTAPFTVTVLNDHPAVVSGNRTVSVLETAEPRSFVTKYTPPGSGNFSILSGNVGTTFAISPIPGDITLLQPLDFNTRSQYILAIGFTDGTTDFLSTSYLTVIVVEVNKFPPVFHDPLSFFVQEELPAGTLLGFVNVTDADKGPLTSKVTLTFLQGPLSTFFVLNSTTGRLVTSMQLDREALQAFFIPPSSVGTATILAQDAGTPSMQTLATIFIVLGDINDNSPNITDTTSDVSILEEALIPVLIFDITATDPDLGLNGTVQYSYVTVTGTAAAANRFAFPNNAAGTFSAIGRLDREQQEQYVFTMMAYDLGTPSRTTTVPRSLTLLDINDNAPTFSQSLYRIKLSDSVVWTNVIFITVVATDPDKGPNGTIQYSLTQDIPFLPEILIEPAVLVLDMVSGGVTVSTTFSFTSQPQINATITATDLGTPPMSSSVLLIVDITSSPKFPAACDGRVYENSPVGTAVTSCTASAQGNVPPIVYSIQSVVTDGVSDGSAWANLFRVEANSGSIVVAAPIDREAFHNSTGSDALTLVIAANDSFNAPSTAQVRITILDINDNAPIFQSVSYSTAFTVSSIAAYTTNVIKVIATDRDEGTNALVTYSVIAQVQSDSATNITIFAQDSAPLGQQLNSSVVVTVTFQSECLLQVYSVDRSSGQITAILLCAVSATPIAANVTLGGSLTISCAVLANTPQQTYQWIQNGTAFTVAQDGGKLVSYNIAGATYSSAGAYGCKVTTPAGTLQSGLIEVTIQVPPMITIPPTNVAVEQGMPAQFMCVAIGIPTPSISWLKNGVPLQQNTNAIQLASTQLSDQAVYSCVASNNAGTAQASANLTIIVPTNVVNALVNNVTNPGNGGTCRRFDITNFQTIVSNATGLAVIPTNVSGSLLCDMTPCVSSPCLNDGTCTPSNSSAGGYTCTCPPGFTGSNCDQPINFCLPTNPCSNGATCISQGGSYMCICPPGTTGPLCQFTSACDFQPCNMSEFCIPTLGSLSGYTCEPSSGLEGTIVTVVPQGIGAIISLDNSLAVFSQGSTTSSGKRRQAGVQDPALLQCESHFLHLNGTPAFSLSLLWICPPGVQPPTNATLDSICRLLLQLKLVTSCYSPSAGQQYLAPPTTLGGVDVGINFVLLSTSGVPLSSQEALTILISSGALTQLQQNGFKASSFMPLVSTGSSPSSGSAGGISTGAAVGIAVGAAVGGLVLAAIIAFLVSLLIITKRRREAVQMSKQNDGGYVIKLRDTKSASSLANLISNEYDTTQHTTRYELTSPPLVPPKPVETPFIQGRESGAYENVVKPIKV